MRKQMMVFYIINMIEVYFLVNCQINDRDIKETFLFKTVKIIILFV